MWGVLKRNRPEPSVASSLEATPLEDAESNDDAESKASVESMPALIDPGLAFDFVDSIGAAAPQGIAEAPSKTMPRMPSHWRSASISLNHF